MAPTIEVRAMRLMTPQMKKVRRCLLWTSIDEECWRDIGRLLNSSAITRMDEATSTRVVRVKATRSVGQLRVFR